MMNKLIILLIFVCGATAKADDSFIGFGVGVFNSPIKVKTLYGGLQEDLYGPFKLKYTLGGWDKTIFVTPQLGYEVFSGGIYASVCFGPALISRPDSFLGGHFQFVEDAHFGILDVQKNQIGVFYRHVSSAGIYNPNVGRDFMGLDIKFPF